ncbi:succinate dehydrogenase iron-sulfur subunit [Blastopirellula marina]|uniref:Succinate dehydrogenase iron-sulfur subunit n=1 Tax=Blastopirellula marina TaxID=124 RepID=A0A2S8FN78_9BACT|nr:succinate dehydrogenase iron-sulfur subunit [Blastopirellula marina]PQO33652.1 succinate dehydrogenase iron-sulfur subunit [Blastopirellula marina]PTL43439.1 succinate dehydrogenase iron-sulfur subunit [Blastopirellula marina]
MIAHANKPKTFYVKILRQDGPGKPSYWQRFELDYEPELNVISVLQKIAAKAKTSSGQKTTPVCWDCGCLEEVCGACTMVINGRVRQSCSALVDKLLEDGLEIELRPMTKFPVVRDLFVDRSRMFTALKKIKGWIPADGYYDLGPGPKQSRYDQETAYPLSECMTCGCCVEACPQYGKIELSQHSNESTEAFEQRQTDAYTTGFVGPAAISQVVLFNLHPTGKMIARDRLDIMAQEGGIQICGNAQNCVAVCPKKIPLTMSIGKIGRQTTFNTLRRWFDRAAKAH